MALQEELNSQGAFLFKHRSNLPLLLLVSGILIKLYQEHTYVSHHPQSMLSGILESMAFVVGMLGLVIRAFTVGYTPKNTSGRNTDQGQVADSLNTTGMYSLIRNPLYLGNYLMWLGVAMLTGNVWFIAIFSLTFWIYYERIVFAEENFLRKKFGQHYLDWASKTAPFLPTSFRYKSPDTPFSWKKVLKKEKNGFFALFLVFFIFEASAEYAVNGTLRTEIDWLLIGTVASGIAYTILKYIKKYTGLLNEQGR
ncbi:lipid A Kdo2 1-phosphate O-methyltransferase [Fulvitalea axinellae]|uniref:Lipid A Kdo2 1-phosphate O-methyltransferase n=1 Tax=Fulvitalea axinellae TaxID=1182444 RepID=A0AAU9CVY3_9BACT|nr:lipid A Kdo2 1-phosphate O-methyltransferase [Fulvitalea axinellae]